MGIVSGALTRPAPTEKRNLSLTDTEGWREAGWLHSSAAGVSVSPEGSLTLAAVWRAVTVLAQGIAALPLKVYERTADGRQVASGFYLYELLHDRPNPVMSRFDLIQALQGHLLLRGNAYCEIESDDRGRVTALWPLRPDKMEKIQLIDKGKLVYSYRLPSGGMQHFPGERIWHLRGLSSDGIYGYSPMQLHRQAVGLGLAAEEFGARFFGNGARPGGVLTHPGTLSDEAYERLKISWNESYGGLSNAHRAAILEDGVTYQEVGFPPEDIQFLETRKFQVVEVARIFGVPPHKLYDLDRATFSNIEHQAIEYVTDSLQPWLVQWEQSIALQLMTETERRRYYAEFLVDGLLRGDTLSRYQSYAVARQNGWMSADEIRQRENMNPLPDGQGEVYLVPLNMIPAGQAGEFEPASGGAQPGDVAGGGRSQESAPEMRTLSNGVEVRASQYAAAAKRRALQVAYVPIYEDVAGRIVRREANDIANAANRLLNKRSRAEFIEWLRRFWEEHLGFVATQYTPVTRTYAAQIADQVAAELDEETPDLESFIAAYAEMAAGRHVGRASSRLDEVIESAGVVGDEELAALITAEMEHWRDERPARIARDESVRASNAMAVAAYGALAVTRKVWVTFGDSCPYCTRLGGKVVSIQQEFVPAGVALDGGEGRPPLISKSSIGHAPAHLGCDCQIVAA